MMYLLGEVPWGMGILPVRNFPQTNTLKIGTLNKMKILVTK